MLFGRLRDLVNHRLTTLPKPILQGLSAALKGVFDYAFESLIDQLELCDAFLSVQTGAIALVSWLMLFLFRSGRKAGSYLLASALRSERTKH
jgi:hypothetical protein